ncbi:MAG: hypothetical protein Q8L10_02505 [Candidatus Moranbacteria bacterium]|nr:hypothetical protein [Candidatus Moranbacteria bacterium]
MEWFLKKAHLIAIKHFHRWYGFFASAFILLIATLVVYGLIPDGRIRFLWYAYGIISLEIFLLICWIVYAFWIPKNNRKKHTGLVLCIYADSEDAEQALKKDFVATVKRGVQNGEIGEVFNVILIKNHLASKYNNRNDIYKLDKKANGHIYIFGETKKRKHGVDQYFLSLDGLVLHRPISHQASQELANDFLATLPKGINFKDEFAFAGFQVSADIVVRCVEYIVGIAAFISGNPFLATKLHTDLKNKILSSQQKLPGDKVILSKIDNLLSNEFALIGSYYLRKNERENANKNIESSLNLNKNCYNALVTKSVIAFSWENDPKKALSICKECHGFNEPTWRYNEAFLHFWLGNYPTAWKQCEKIKRQNYPSEVIISQEITQFNESLVSKVEKPVLYFWLGFNYYYKQGNLPLAFKNFEIFLQKADDAGMNNLKQKASGWTAEIKKKCNWK